MEYKEFSYQFDAGPFSNESELSGHWNVGNCRRMVQWYFFVMHELFLRPEQVLCPEAYHETGRFVFAKGDEIDASLLRAGDIIYAERVRSKSGDVVDRSEGTFATPDEYIISLHTALFVGASGGEILHATSIEGRSCVWPLQQFTSYYRPIAVKRILTE